MKQIFTLILALLISFSLNTSYAQTFDGTSPYTTKCAYQKPHLFQKVSIYRQNTKQKLGILYLWGSSTCRTAWAQFIARYPAINPYKTYVWVVSYDHKELFRTQYQCPNLRGNCTTPQVENQIPWKAKAELDIIDRQTSTPIGYATTNKQTGQ